MSTVVKNIKVQKDKLLIFESADDVDSFFIVKSGQLEISKMGTKERVVLGHVGPGELVGEMSAIDGMPRSATVKAITDCELIEIPQASLSAILKNQPEWFKTLLSGLVAKLRKTNLKIKHS